MPHQNDFKFVLIDQRPLNWPIFNNRALVCEHVFAEERLRMLIDFLLANDIKPEQMIEIYAIDKNSFGVRVVKLNEREVKDEGINDGE